MNARAQEFASGKKPAAGQPGQAPLEERLSGLGLTVEQFNNLKRTNKALTPEMLASIPPSNRKNVIAKLEKAAADMSRLYQQTRDQTNKLLTDPDSADADDPGQAAPPASPEAPPPGATPPATAKTKSSPAPKADAPAAPPEKWLADADVQTLEDLGGADLAPVIESALGRMAQRYGAAIAQMEQANQVLQRQAEFLLQRQSNADFDSAMQKTLSLRGHPPMDDQARAAVRKLADEAIAIRGDLSSFGYDQAIEFAINSLFPDYNPVLAAQLREAETRTPVQRGSASRPNAGNAAPPPTLNANQTRNGLNRVGELIAQGVGKDEAFRQVFGAR
jgi:hypothetical protein